MTYAEKLTALRAALAAQNLDGFIAPRTDEFMGEYLPPSAERVAWLTGFTGSAGAAIVLLDKAVVMSDGRYTEQLKMEVDSALYALADSTVTGPTVWLAENAKMGARIGYDPRLHTVQGLAALEKALAAKDVTLVPVAANPIDDVWQDRPVPPASAVELFADEIAGRSAAEKRTMIAEAVTKAGGAAVILTAPESIAWLLNIRGNDVPHTPLALSYAVARADGDVEWFIASSRVSADVRRALGNSVVLREPVELDHSLGEIATTADKPILLDAARAPVWFKRQLEDAGTTVQDFEDPCIIPRACKTDAERENIVAAHVRDGAALVRCLHWLDETAPGGALTELDVVAKLREFRASDPLYRDDSFDTISGWAAHGAIVHYRVNDKTNAKIVPPGLLLLDSGAQYADGTTDVTRTLAIGAPSEEMRENFTLVLKGHIAIATARFPTGTTGLQLDALARNALWQAGRDYDHGTGHGVGCYLSVHEEAASISKRPGRAIMPGMLISNEPGFYKAGEYGIRIENLVFAREDRKREGSDVMMLAFDTVTLAPIDRHLIDIQMLSAAEWSWVNAYHARVWEMLSPLLDGPVLDWLRRATAPL